MTARPGHSIEGVAPAPPPRAKWTDHLILPAPKLLWLLVGGAAIALIAPRAWQFALLAGYDLALALVVVMDLGSSIRSGELAVERRLPEHLSLGASNTVGWTLRNGGAHDAAFELTEDIPEGFERDKATCRGRLLARARGEVYYAVTPPARGRYAFGDIYLRYRTRLGLLVHHRRLRRSDIVKVYPNVQSLTRYALALQRHRLTDLGMSPARMRAKGRIFESLRDYVPGDDVGDIAWKASARRGNLIVRNFEADRSQHILLVLDCGRLMTTQVDALSRLDHAINASLLLTYAALKQGDAIGMLAFSDDVQRYVPPAKGRGVLPRLNEALYELSPSTVEPNYEKACRFLALRNRKRSLIVIFTDVVSTDASSMLLAYAARFARRHLPLCVTLRNLELEKLATAAPRDTQAAYAKAVALDMLAEREAALERMRHSGVDVLDVNPRALTPAVLNRYLLLKRSNRL